MLCIIKKIIKNDDIAHHIYNLYLIKKYFQGTVNDTNINLFLNYFKNKRDYWNFIFSSLNFNKIDISIKRLIINDEILKIIIHKNPNIIRILDNHHRNNEMVIREVCYNNSYFFKYASPALKFNINFILKLLEINSFIYFFIDDKLKSNNDIIEKIKKINPFILFLN